MVLLTNYNSAATHSARLAILSALTGLPSEIGYRLCSLSSAHYSLNPTICSAVTAVPPPDAASRRRIFGKNRSTR